MTGSIAFHALAPDGRDAVVLLLQAGAEPGRVRYTEWPASGFAQPGRTGESTADEVERRVADWERAGWRFSESPIRIRAWLRSPA